jgi:hypothetical protein
MSTNTLIGYSPNDFLYVQAANNNTMPSSSRCSEIQNNFVVGNALIDTGNCSVNSLHFHDISNVCFEYGLCNNKDKASQLSNLENTHLGATEKNMNEKMNYDIVLMNTINLGIGIVFLLVVIYQNRK